ncbi:MAG: hypothetical protein RIE08_13930 [Acidimicrobiales bacterium]
MKIKALVVAVALATLAITAVAWAAADDDAADDRTSDEPPVGDASDQPNTPPDGGDDVDGGPTEPGDPGDVFPTEQARQDAQGYLGRNENTLPDEVRVGRRGAEQMMLTEDYVLGRVTVSLDDDGDGYRVTSVTVELPDGPETFDLQPS